MTQQEYYTNLFHHILVTGSIGIFLTLIAAVVVIILYFVELGRDD